MQYAPRTIAFISELFHPLIQPDPAAIQKVHNELFQSGDPTYRSFAVVENGAVLSNPSARPGGVSSASFLPDRIQFREELSSLTVEEFSKRVQTLCELVVERIGVQVFTAQQVTIRTLVNPKNFKDSRTFLKRGMFGFGGETDSLGREPKLFGIRMVFPPNEEQANAYSLRIESFNNDPRSLFIENQANFAPILVARGLESLSENIENAYRFLVERALSFVGRFDTRQEA